MAKTTIEVSSKTWTRLNQEKQPGESFDDVIQREVINTEEHQ